MFICVDDDDDDDDCVDELLLFVVVLVELLLWEEDKGCNLLTILFRSRRGVKISSKLLLLLSLLF